MTLMKTKPKFYLNLIKQLKVNQSTCLYWFGNHLISQLQKTEAGIYCNKLSLPQDIFGL